MKLAIRMDSKDNVATATDILKKQEIILVLEENGREIDKLQVTMDIPLPFHKIALVHILAGGEIRKYGEVIGYALKTIEKGEWVHVHNVESASLPGRDLRGKAKWD